MRVGDRNVRVAKACVNCGTTFWTRLEYQYHCSRCQKIAAKAAALNRVVTERRQACRDFALTEEQQRHMKDL